MPILPPSLSLSLKVHRLPVKVEWNGAGSQGAWWQAGGDTGCQEHGWSWPSHWEAMESISTGNKRAELSRLVRERKLVEGTNLNTHSPLPTSLCVIRIQSLYIVSLHIISCILYRAWVMACHCPSYLSTISLSFNCVLFSPALDGDPEGEGQSSGAH